MGGVTGERSVGLGAVTGEKERKREREREREKERERERERESERERERERERGERLKKKPNFLCRNDEGHLFSFEGGRLPF